jgi:hypothetical protein
VLANEQSAWPSTAGKDGGFKMGGYALDEKRRPTFFYSYKGLRIDEGFEPVMGEVDAYFKRTFKLTGAAVDHLWFRAARGNISTKGDAFLLDEKVTMKFPNAKPLLRGNGQDRELIVPVEFTGENAQLVEEIIW